VADARVEDVEIEWIDYMIVGARRKSLDRRRAGGAIGDHDETGVAGKVRRADFLERCDRRQQAQAHVDQDDVNRPRHQHGKRTMPILRQDYVIIEVRQTAGDDVPRCRVLVHQQHAHPAFCLFDGGPIRLSEQTVDPSE